MEEDSFEWSYHKISSTDSKVTSAVPKSTTFTLRVEELRRVHCFFSILVGKKGISDKEEKPYVPSHNTLTYLVLVGRKRTHTTVRKE